MNNKFKLEKIVREFMAEDLGLDMIDRRYPRYLTIAINGLRELNYDSPHFGIKEVVLDINSNDTVDLPEDFLDYYAIGTCNDHGELQVIGLNDNLCKPGKDDCGNTEFTLSTSRPFYKFDLENGCIITYGVSNGVIVLRYKSDISKINGTYQVHGYDVEAVKNYIWWKSIRRQRSRGLQESRDAEKAWNKSKKVAIRRHARFTLSEFMDAFRSGYSIAPRI